MLSFEMIEMTSLAGCSGIGGISGIGGTSRVNVSQKPPVIHIYDEHQTALYNGLTDTTYADTGVINSVMAIDENRPLGRQNKWTKDVYLQLEEAEKKGRQSHALFRKLDNEDYEQDEIEPLLHKKQV